MCVAFAFAAPVFLCLRYDTKKGQTAQPWATPAQAILGGDRPEAAAGRGATSQGPPRAAGPPAGAPGAAGDGREDFLLGRHPGGPRAGGAAGRRARHCAAPARDACPGVPPRGAPNVKPPGQHHLCSHKWRVVYQLGTVHLTISRHCLHEGRHLPYVFVQGSLRPVVGVAHLFDP